MSHPLAVAIVNPSTGRRAVDDLTRLLCRELSKSYSLEVQLSEHAGHTTELARLAGRTANLVIAVGGDGTVSEVATGLLGSQARLGIIPVGSANVIARGLGIPHAAARAARLLCGPHDIRILDALRLGDRLALHMVGCGFDALMVEAAPKALKRAVAWFAYVPAALANVNEGPWRFEFTVDDYAHVATAKMILIANGSFILEPRFELGSGIRADDGKLDVLVFSPPNLVAATSVASRLALGQLEGSPHVEHYRGRTVQIHSDPPAPVEADGDAAGTTPITIEVVPAAMSVIVPRWLPGARPTRQSAG